MKRAATRDGNPITSRVWVATPMARRCLEAPAAPNTAWGMRFLARAEALRENAAAGKIRVQYNEYTVPTTTRTTSLSPEQQQLYDKSLSAQNGLLDLRNSQIGRLQQTLGAPFTLAGMPARQNRY